MREALSGNLAAAWGFRLSRVRRYAGYPITPSTVASEMVARWINDGELRASFGRSESEHSAISDVIAASTSVRSGTATSSKGLQYMLEVAGNAAGYGLSPVLYVGNRATGEPINIWGDNQDAYAFRDCGWIQLFARNAQELLDGIIQAYRIGEDPGVRLPVAVNAMGFFVTHTYEPVDIPDQEAVDAFLPPFISPHPLFDPDRPVTYGPMLSAEPYRRHKRNQAEAMAAAREAIARVGQEFGRHFGRTYGLCDWVGEPRAELAVVLVGEAAETAAAAITSLAGVDGIPPVAALHVRSFSPFPGREAAEALSAAGVKAVAVLDQGLPHGGVGAPLFERVAAALLQYGPRPLPAVVNVIGGLGGTELSPGDFQSVYNLLFNIARGRPCRAEPYWLDIPEDPLLMPAEGHQAIDAKLWHRYRQVWEEQPANPAFFQPVPTKAREVRIHGRAGQGMVTTATLLNGAAVHAGMHSIARPQFGSERRGAPVQVDVSLSQERSLRSFSGRWDTVVVAEDSLLPTLRKEIAPNLKAGGTVVVGTKTYSTEKVRRFLGLSADQRALTVDAESIAKGLGVWPHFNTVVLGAIHAVEPEPSLDECLDYYARHVPGNKERSAAAIKAGYEGVGTGPAPAAPPELTEEVRALVAWRPPTPGFVATSPDSVPGGSTAVATQVEAASRQPGPNGQETTEEGQRC